MLPKRVTYLHRWEGTSYPPLPLPHRLTNYAIEKSNATQPRNHTYTDGRAHHTLPLPHRTTSLPCFVYAKRQVLHTSLALDFANMISCFCSLSLHYFPWQLIFSLLTTLLANERSNTKRREFTKAIKLTQRRDTKAHAGPSPLLAESVLNTKWVTHEENREQR